MIASAVSCTWNSALTEYHLVLLSIVFRLIVYCIFIGSDGEESRGEGRKWESASKATLRGGAIPGRSRIMPEGKQCWLEWHNWKVEGESGYYHLVKWKIKPKVTFVSSERCYYPASCTLLTGNSLQKFIRIASVLHESRSQRYIAAEYTKIERFGVAVGVLRYSLKRVLPLRPGNCPWLWALLKHRDLWKVLTWFTMVTFALSSLPLRFKLQHCRLLKM